MKNIFPHHNRRSIRLKKYNYSTPGFYFITICTREREMLFGKVQNNHMILNINGKIAKSEWEKTYLIRNNILLDYYIVMPNHIHGIIQITSIQNVGTYSDTPLLQTGFKSPSRTIGSIIRGYKSAVTKQINKQRNTAGTPVWQRNYYEHIIRNEKELNNIRKYIIDNPFKWG